MSRVMQHQFAKIPSVSVPRSQFDRSFTHKTTFNSGLLIPFFWDHVLPGDTYNCHADIFARLATPIVPAMDNLWLDTFYFFVPYRLVWTNFVKMMGEQDNPGDSTDYVMPVVDFSLGPNQWPDFETIYDYFGLPVGTARAVTDDYTANALPFRSYNLIWNEWFRDQNLQSSVTVNKGDAADAPGTYSLLYRGRRHDYFTASLPFPQKGAAVTLPLGSSAPVVGNADVWGTASLATGVDSQKAKAPIGTYWDDGIATGEATYLKTILGEARVGHEHGAPGGASTDELAFLTKSASQAYFAGAQAPFSADGSTLHADLSSATAATINTIRLAVTMQQLLERDARGGTRYTEVNRAHFGVVSPDSRLQRPEYLGGGCTRIVINPVAQTSVSATTPQGNLAAFGTGHVRGNGFVKSFVEHGVVIGLMQVRADQTYQQGLDRFWSKSSRFDLYWPTFASLGEQEVRQSEIYFTSTDANDDAVWGYQERYAEYRYKPSMVTGLFRSTYSQPLDMWHYAIYFSGAPALNSNFIQDTPPIQRTVAVENPYPEFKADIGVRCMAARPMPMFSVPGLMRL